MEKQNKVVNALISILIMLGTIYGVIRTLIILYHIKFWLATLITVPIALIITLFWIRYFKKRKMEHDISKK